MDIRNNAGRLVCRVDKLRRTVEIVQKGCTTLISFSDDGRINVINKNKTA